MVDLTVPFRLEGSWEGTDFVRHEAITTPALETCFSAITWYAYERERNGTLAHFSVKTPPERFDEYVRWLKREVPFYPFARLFLVGGRTGESEKAIGRLEERLHALRFQEKIQKDVLGTDRRTVRLTKEGKLEIVSYRQNLADRDNVEYVRVGTNVLE